MRLPFCFYHFTGFSPLTYCQEVIKIRVNLYPALGKPLLYYWGGHSKVKQAISIKDIAERAGVSIATVSRVINQNGRFSNATGDRVRAVIAETGYEPNLLARSLRTNRARVVGIIMPDITNEFYSGVTLELQNNLLAMGYSAIICNTQGSFAVEQKYHQLLRAQQISGIIYLEGQPDPDQQMMDIPIVYIDRNPAATLHTQEFAIVQTQSREGAFMVASELIRAGGRSLGVIAVDDQTMTGSERLEGFRQALAEVNMPLSPAAIAFADEHSITQGSLQARKLLEANPQLDSVFCTSDLLAYGAMSYFEKQGRQVLVAGYGDLAFSTLYGLTTVRQSPEDYGGIAAELLISMIEDRTPENTEISLPVSLIRRASSKR